MKAARKTGLLLICFALLITLVLQTKAEGASYKFNMAYLNFGDCADYTEYVDKTQRSLSEVSPNYFALNSDGSLALTYAVSKSFVDDMHERQIAVVPYLSNDWSREKGKAAMKNRVKLAEALADAVRKYNLDGVNIDIENLTVTEREATVDFARLLRQLMPGKRIVMSVAANPWGISTGWQGSYDYARLAEYCDYLMYMCYDEHYYGGSAGPVSSMSYIEKTIKYALSAIPREKIVIGLPFYGRIWSADGGTLQGNGVSNATIARFIQKYGGAVHIDRESQSTRAVITIKPDDPKPVFGGQPLCAGTYTIWYESEQSLKAKLALISKYNLKGTGSWCLGQETTDTWDYYKLRLNNCPFTDIETSWAKDYILDAYLNNYITGLTAEDFSPDTPLTRAQAAVILVRCLGLTPVADPASSFDDCTSTWAQPYIETARKLGIVTGTGGNLFEPDKPVSRSDIVIMLNRILALQKGYGNIAPSVSPISDFQAVHYTVAQLSSGSAPSDGGIAIPSDIITRAQMTVLLAQLPNVGLSSGIAASPNAV